MSAKCQAFKFSNLASALLVVITPLLLLTAFGVSLGSMSPPAPPGHLSDKDVIFEHGNEMAMNVHCSVARFMCRGYGILRCLLDRTTTLRRFRGDN